MDAPDEMFEAAGAPRPHAARFVRAFDALSRSELSRRWDSAQRHIRENGITYNVYDDSRGMDRPWQLDPVPLLFEASAFHGLARALTQRAHLLDLILRDIYGPQHLLRAGLLPARLIYGNPAFLRPCTVPAPASSSRMRSEPAPSERGMLDIYAADVVRAADGEFVVLGDRTQAPSGMGYALENRIVLSRAFPIVYRDCHIQRLAPFFRALLDSLERQSPRQTEQPHIVLLTPGRYNETYFEHAYLARYLGLPLVEGADLTVRDRIVYLKTLGGLQRIDVILRRVDDSFCDPLTLRADSWLGVAGLVSAVRAGNVRVVNSLGSGLAETRALSPLLPDICRYLLDEELAMPTVPRYHCADPKALSHVEAHLDKLVIKSAFPTTPTRESIISSNLSKLERQSLLERIRARPFEYIAEEQITLSTAPTWTGDELSCRRVVFRGYVIADVDAGEPGYRAMSGGLIRVGEDPKAEVVSMQRGAGSKDMWVLADGPISQVSLLGRGAREVALSRRGGDLPSRVADNLFWLGRYVERTEGTARLLRALLSRLADEMASDDAPELPVLTEALSAHAETNVAPNGQLGDPALLEPALLSFTRSDQGSHTLLSSMRDARRATAAVRDRISGDTWRVLSQLRVEEHALERGKQTVADVLEVLDGLVLKLAAFAGLQTESLSRTLGFRFIDMGRRLERARSTAQLLRVAFAKVHVEEPAVLVAVLEVLDNAITYRRRYQAAVQLAPVLDLVLIDEDNPRSVASQLATLQEHVQQLPRAIERPFRTPEERIILAALTRLRLSDIGSLSTPAKDGSRPALDALLESIMRELPGLSDSLTRSYLAHAMPHHAFGASSPM